MSLSSRGRTLPPGASLLLLASWVLPGTALLWSPVPRSAPPPPEVEQRVQRFFTEGISNYSMFQVDSASGMLYVGAKDAILKFTLNSVVPRKEVIHWMVSPANQESCMQKGKKELECHNYIRILELVNRTHLFTCGTFAFDPLCGYIKLVNFEAVESLESGRGKCPFEPAQPSTAVMADGKLYAATVKNFLGTESLISKSTASSEERIRTETSALWLNDPTFVASSFVRESPAGDDDKVYFFFTETTREYNFYKKMKVPRVARVCKGDVGGQKTLQKRWTTFLKTQLVCTDDQSGIDFNVLEGVFTLQTKIWNSTIFYGIFTAWSGTEVSAICAFDIEDIARAFEGPFKELETTCDKWSTVNPSKVPTPRPGACITESMQSQGVTSYPDRVLTFIRDHPLMEQGVTPKTKGPILVKHGTRYRKLAVTKVTALDGNEYDVLYLGTDRGHLHKAVVTGSATLLLEDLTLYREDQPIESLQLYEDWLYIGSSSEVTQMNLTDCARHDSCVQCILARDPACAWSPSDSACVEHRGQHRYLQDVVSGNVASICPKKDPKNPPDIVAVAFPLGARVVLPCTPLSAWGTCEWTTPEQGGGGYTSRSDGLEFTMTPESFGNYECRCWENEAGGVVASYSVMKSSGSTAGLVSSGRSYVVLASVLCFLVGFVVGCVIFALYERKRRKREALRRQQSGLDLMQSNNSCSNELPTPSSPNDEKHPLANSLNRGLNGFTQHYFSEKDQARIILSNAPLAHCDETSI